ncbi:hypothetical protein B2A_10856, partial [mine drainage metagenome]
GNTGLALLDEPSMLPFDLGVLNSSTFLSLLALFMPRGSEGDSTTLKYELGYVAAVPFPRASPEAMQRVTLIVRNIAAELGSVIRLDERSTLWPSVERVAPSMGEVCDALSSLPLLVEQVDADVRALQEQLDEEVVALYALTASLDPDRVRKLGSDLAVARSEMHHSALTTCTTLEAKRRVVSFAIGLLFGRWSGREQVVPK